MTSFDAVIVGSGFGGAVSAARLADAGLRVCVLERGRWWGPGDADRRPFPRGVRQVARALRNVRINRGRVRKNLVRDADGLYELHLHRHLDMLTASGVGGGSLIYTNMQVEPDDSFFDAFPADLRGGEMAPYYQRVREMLRPEPIKTLPPKNAAFEAGLRSVGREDELEYPDIAVALGDPENPTGIVNAAGREQTTCNWCGNCVLGCMERAKTTLDLTYLPAALDAGAEIRTRAEVEVFAPIDTSGSAPGFEGWDIRYLDHAAGRRRRVRARRLILAAGTLGTLRLLLAGRDRFRTLPSLSDRLGTSFTGNADQGALLVDTDRTFRGEVGPAVNAFIRHRDADGRHRAVAGEVGIPSAGLGLPRQVQKRLESTHMLIYMGADRTSATVELDGEELAIDQANSHDPGIFAEFDAETAALAKAFGAGRDIRRLALGRDADSNFSVHPLGGAALADSTRDGVCDPAGRAFGVENLYVADGALYPKAPGLPPSMTIAALAERISTLITQE